MVRIIFFAVMLVLLYTTGCKPTAPAVKYKLTDDQLAYLLLDMQWTELVLADLSPERKDTLKDLLRWRFSEIYNMTEAELKAELDKLGSDPEKMMVILDKVKNLADSIR